MKPFLITDPSLPPQETADVLLAHGWSLADVLEWFAGRPCGFNPAGACNPCPTQKCYSDPPTERGRDVLAAFILQGGATHERHEAMAEEMKEWGVSCGMPGWFVFNVKHHDYIKEENFYLSKAEADLALKRRVLRLFSRPVKDEKCDMCDGIGDYMWPSENGAPVEKTVAWFAANVGIDLASPGDSFTVLSPLDE